MSPFISSLRQYLINLSLRERLLLLIVILSILYAVWDTFIFSKQQQQYQRLVQQKILLEQKQRETLQTLNKNTVKLAQIARVKQDKENAISQARIDLEKTSAQLDELLHQLVPPTKMTDLLQNLLLQTHGLKLIELRNEPVRTITLLDKNEDNSTPNQPYSVLYRHATIIKLTGSYQQLYQYLKAIEQSKWSLYWDNLNYHVTDYPNAEITLRVHTVSTDKYWIGL